MNSTLIRRSLIVLTALTVAAPRFPVHAFTLPCSEDTTWRRYDVDTSKDIAAVKLFVATTGNDANAGTAASPLATIGAATAKLRPQLGTISGDAIVYVRGGTYAIDTTPVIITKDDGGKNGHHVIYKNFPGEIPVLEAGRQITGWTKASGNVWQAQLPDVQSGKWWFRGLYVDDKRANRKNTETLTSNPNSNMYEITHASEGFTGSAAMCTNANDWALDKASGTLYYNSGTVDPSTKKIFAENAKRAIAVSGAIDSKVKNLEIRGFDVLHTFWPLPSPGGWKGFAGGMFYISGGYDDIQVAVECEYADSLTISYLYVAHNSGSGIGFGRGVTNSIIRHCYVTDVGCDGIINGWCHKAAVGFKPCWMGCGCNVNGTCVPNLTCTWLNEPRNVPTNNTIADNNCTIIGRIYELGAGIRARHCPQVYILYNRIVGTIYNGMFANEGIVQCNYNEIGSTGPDPVLWDQGAIYHSTQGGIPKPEFRGNFFYDNPRVALYLDVHGDSAQITENTCYQVAQYGIYVDHMNFGTHAWNNYTATTTQQVCDALKTTGPRKEGGTVAAQPIVLTSIDRANPAIRSIIRRDGILVESLGSTACAVELLTPDGRVVGSSALTPKNRTALIGATMPAGVRLIRVRSNGQTTIGKAFISQ